MLRAGHGLWALRSDPAQPPPRETRVHGDGKCSLHQTRPRKQAHWLRSSLQSKGNPAHVLWATDRLRSNLTPDSGPADMGRNGGPSWRRHHLRTRPRRPGTDYNLQTVWGLREACIQEGPASQGSACPATPALKHQRPAPHSAAALTAGCQSQAATPGKCRPGMEFLKLTLKIHQIHKTTWNGLTTH